MSQQSALTEFTSSDRDVLLLLRSFSYELCS